GLFSGEYDGGAGARAFLGIDAKIAAMHAGQRISDGQAQPSAFMSAVEGGLDLAEGAHSSLDFGRRHASTGISHGNRRVALLQNTRLDADAAAVFGEFHGIAEEIDEDLFDPQRITDDQWQSRIEGRFNGNRLFARLGLDDEQAGP